MKSSRASALFGWLLGDRLCQKVIIHATPGTSSVTSVTRALLCYPSLILGWSKPAWAAGPGHGELQQLPEEVHKNPIHIDPLQKLCEFPTMFHGPSQITALPAACRSPSPGVCPLSVGALTLHRGTQSPWLLVDNMTDATKTYHTTEHTSYWTSERVPQCVSAVMEMSWKDVAVDNECLLLLAPKIHSACLLLVPRIENDLLPRESAMIGAVLKNVLKVERGKNVLWLLERNVKWKNLRQRVFGRNVILKGQMIGNRSRLADLKRKVNVFKVRKITEYTEIIVGLGNANNT